MMVSWKPLIVVAAVSLQCFLAAPTPDEYQIPQVGNNQRSQFYVLHDDGTYKYGFDTGENAFESQKLKSDGEVEGKFGYKNPDGDDVKLEYTSGTSGFVARGSHIPQVHPDVTAAFEAARAAGPFEDPLADAEGDRSYNFGFDGEEYKRDEVSNSDGTVTGSYSYVDEFGRTRNYRYRAGKGIGFVIEGDDIPEPVEPLPSHSQSSVAQSTRTSVSSGARAAGSHSSSRAHSVQQSAHSGFSSHSSTRTSGNRNVGSTVRKTTHSHVSTPSRTYFPPTPSRSHASVASTQSHSSTHFTSSDSSSERNFEPANTRTSFSPSGSYSLAYETSSHTRQESGDDDNNVDGSFTFTADDTGDDHQVTYEAGSDTGFIASGDHLPVGPSVPGASSGQVTGRLEPVPHFDDPLARDLDPSFNFEFDGEEYSRNEVADDEGNVVGQYSVLGEDNILRTYRYRAGKGIGFELEEISSRPGSSTRRTTSTSSHSGSSNSGQTSTRIGSSSAGSHGSHSSRGSSFSSTRTTQGGQATRASYGSSTSHGTSGNKHVQQTVRTKSSGSQVFPGFSLRQYDASEGRGKYGYVLRFDD